MIKIGTFVKVTNLEKIYSFCDSKGRKIIPISYNSLSKHFDECQVVDEYVGDDGNKRYKLLILANTLYRLIDVEANDIEEKSSYWTIDLEKGIAKPIDKPTNAMKWLGLVFNTEDEANEYFNKCKKDYETKF